MIVVEVIATTPQEALDAEQAGADRIELISAPIEGGLTPSYALVEKVKSLVKIPVHVMIRPHAKSFVYDSFEKAVMLHDIQSFKELDVDCFVIGALTDEGRIDTAFLDDVVNVAGKTAITFHRAIDEVEDIDGQIQRLAQYPTIKRVLTSYGNGDIMDHLNEMNLLNQEMLQHHQMILAGGGLSVNNLERFLMQTGIKEVHFGRGVRCDNHYYGELDPQKIFAIRAIVDKVNELC